MRWAQGQMTPIGGHKQLAYTFASRCRAIHGWFDLSGTYRIAYLCEANLYVDTGGNLTEITPSSGLVAPVPTTTGGYGDGLYGQGSQLPAAGTWTTASTTITMSGNPGAAPAGLDVYDVTAAKDIGKVSTYVSTSLVLQAAALAASSSSTDMMNFGAYGEPRPLTTTVAIDRMPPCYSLDNFGSVLYAMTSADGRLLKWDPAVGGLATQEVSNGAGADPGGYAPRGRCFVVTAERFIMVFSTSVDGTTAGGSQRRFCWCDQENPQHWDFSTVTSQAGFLDIEPASPIVCAIATRTGVLFWTAKKAYRSRFLGLPYVYNYEELADNCTPWSPESMATTSSMVLWQSQQGTFSFDGTSILPVECMVLPWVLDDIDLLNVRSEAFAAHVENFNEWWWFYPQFGQAHPTRAVIYNYKEGWWGQVRMTRSAGITASYTAHTIMADGTIAFQHEVQSTLAGGFFYAYANCDPPFAETFDLNVAQGSRLVTVKQLLPDIEVSGFTDPTATANAVSQVGYSLFYRNSRSYGDPELQTPFATVRSNGYVDLRTTGRDIRLRFDILSQPQQPPSGNPPSNLPVTNVPPVTVGQHMIDIVTRGDR